MNSENFETSFKQIIEGLKVDRFYDGIAGEDGYKIFKAMPNRSITYMIGYLSNKPYPSQAYNHEIIYNGKTLSGFSASNWFRQNSNCRIKTQITANLKQYFRSGVYKTHIQKKF